MFTPITALARENDVALRNCKGGSEATSAHRLQRMDSIKCAEICGGKTKSGGSGWRVWRF